MIHLLLSIYSYTAKFYGPNKKVGISSNLQLVEKSKTAIFDITHEKEENNYYIKIKNNGKYITKNEDKLEMGDEETKWIITVISNERFLIHNEDKCWAQMNDGADIVLEDCPVNVDSDPKFFWNVEILAEFKDIPLRD